LVWCGCSQSRDLVLWEAQDPRAWERHERLPSGKTEAHCETFDRAGCVLKIF
jgi:hypothetical protein